jgi:hypothetical protein
VIKRGSSTLYLLFALLITAAAPIYAGTACYVDSTNGSDTNDGLAPETPWKTINKVNNSIFLPGDSILFKRGETWRETLIPPSHGSSGNNILFGAYGTGAPPKIDGSGRDYCVNGNKDYITFTDLHFTSPKKYGIAHTKWTSNGIELSTPGWIIKNSTFTRCGVYLFGPDTIVQDNVFVGPSPITWNDGAVIIRGLVAVNCSVLRNNISGYNSRGIWFLGVAGAATANDNVVHDIAHTVGSTWEGYGINFDGYGSPITGTVTVLRNTVYNCARNGIEMENCSDGSVISGNLIHDCRDAGILYLNYAAGQTYADQRGQDVGAIVKYNIIYHCTNCIRLQEVSGVAIWNNTLYDGTGSYPCGLSIDEDVADFVKNIDFRNNIVGSGMTRSCTTGKTWKNRFIAFDYNAVVNPVMEIRSPSSTLTLAQLQSGGAALNCFTTSPGFVNAAGHDFHLLPSSPCINAGVSVGLTQDYEGNNIQRIPDIGAYESGPPGSTTLPTVITTVPSAIQSGSATGGGIVTSDGGATVTGRGVCWGLPANPTISGSHTSDGSGTGSYVSILTGLSSNATYHVRAYATNSVGTGYGDDVGISTAAPAKLRVPVLLTPVNGATGQPTAIKLSWRDRNVSPEEAGYMIRIKPIGGTYIYYGVGPNSQSYELSGLLKRTKYYWNVKANGNGQTTLDSSWANSAVDRSFKTGSR